MTIQSTFSDSGLNLGENRTNLTYLYGLSDFFSVMFEDTSTINLLLETSTQEASEIYSKFLQLTSSISLEGIQEVINSSIKLVLLSESDKVTTGTEPNTYRLPESIRYSKYVANRAFLPTELLDADVDFRITQDPDGSSYIQFAKPLKEYAFPVRLLSDGITEQRAIWLVDSEVDEKLMYTYFGKLIGIDPEASSERFSNFVYGLFYVYMHGPKISTLSRGLNLALGIPVARAQEEVLSIRSYLETDQYIVICDQNQYVIPYGLSPSVEVGQTLSVGDPIAEWVEIKDWETDGVWWINLSIPKRFIPQIPEGQEDRYAKEGSPYDLIMRNYLKKHTFLVKVKVESFKNIQQFSQISDIIKRAKPCYTDCIYIWTLSDTETLSLNETFKITSGAFWDESFKPCISRLRRDNTDDPLLRGNHHFIRYNVDKDVERICGTDSYISDYTSKIGEDFFTGFVNPIAQFRTNTGREVGWIRAILNRGHVNSHGYRDKIGFHRFNTNTIPDVPAPVSQSIPSGVGVPVRAEDSWQVPLVARMVPIYTIQLKDLTDLMKSLNVPTTDTNRWWFEIFSERAYSEAINEQAINYLPPKYDPEALRNLYLSVFFKNVPSNYLGKPFNEQSLRSWAPNQSDINPGDYLLCVKITESVVGVYWITYNFNIYPPIYWTVGEIDPVVATYNMPISRSGGLNGAPYYAIRGARTLNYDMSTSPINEIVINEGPEIISGSQSMYYSDKYNTTPVIIDRDTNLKFIHAMEDL